MSVEKGIKSTVIAAASSRVREEAKRYAAAYIVPSGEIGNATAQSQDPKLAKELKTLTDEKMKECSK